jgi:hypothetical protein
VEIDGLQGRTDPWQRNRENSADARFSLMEGHFLRESLASGGAGFGVVGLILKCSTLMSYSFVFHCGNVNPKNPLRTLLADVMPRDLQAGVHVWLLWR